MNNKKQHIPSEVACNIMECPIHEKCIHYLAYTNQKADNIILRMLNHSMLKIDDTGCQYAHIPQQVRIARGFKNMYDTLPKTASRNVWQSFPRCASRRQFYRLLNGEAPLDPEFQDAVLTFFAGRGANTALGFDEYEDVVM